MATSTSSKASGPTSSPKSTHRTSRPRSSSSSATTATADRTPARSSTSSFAYPPRTRTRPTCSSAATTTSLSPRSSESCLGLRTRGSSSPRRGRSTRGTRIEKGGSREMGTRICTCKGGGGVGLSRRGSMWRRGRSTRARSMMLGLLLSPTVFLMGLLVLDLVKAVPDEHKKFLADLVWVHEENDVCVETDDGLIHCKLIAVHAGLERNKNVEEQLNFLRARDTRVPKVEALSGRKNVWDIPKGLTENPTIVVSGHHGKLHVNGLRLIIDEGGGFEGKPVAAIVLPSMKIVRDTDVLAN
ncbi:uncharacterized protein LOC132191765 isoform X2 [Corylus avellana]|uniref:uncharacterized protein LOC132191765 isoform X2 n=1 Tax=Corylus avellana TaxID=13451 RepID=UPI002869F4AE|nr:uncharacterized protein LOC132191765 isoform X2 [Corylus avellana]